MNINTTSSLLLSPKFTICSINHSNEEICISLNEQFTFYNRDYLFVILHGVLYLLILFIYIKLCNCLGVGNAVNMKSDCDLITCRWDTSLNI